MRWVLEKWRMWWLLHHPRLKRELAGSTPGHGAPRCPTCDGIIGKCDHGERW